MSQIEDFITQISADDPTFEGVVIRDNNDHRWKVKSPAYFGLHQLKGEGDNLWNPKYLMPFVVNGESDELLQYFPEVADAFAYYDEQYKNLSSSLQTLWDQTKHIEDQKEFALAVKDHPSSSFLFQAKKGQGDPVELLRKNLNYLAKKIVKFHERSIT